MLDLTDRADLAWLSRLVSDARASVPGIDLLLVGALARDIRLTYAHGVPLSRATADVDLGFPSGSWAELRVQYQALLEAGLFKEVTEMRRVRHQGQRPVDLIPFGGIELEGGWVIWPPHADVIGRVIGFLEVRENAELIQLPGGVELAVATLPGLLILKLFAFEDRWRSEPRKDAEDIFAILHKYLDAGNQERLYAEHMDLLEAEEFDYAEAGARIAGRDVGALLRRHETGERLAKELLRIITAEIDPGEQVRFLGQVPTGKAEEARSCLRAFKEGLIENT